MRSEVARNTENYYTGSIDIATPRLMPTIRFRGFDKGKVNPLPHNSSGDFLALL